MVDEPQSLDGELAQAIFVQMMRDGILPAETLHRVMATFDQQAKRARWESDRDRSETLSRMAFEVLLSGDGPSTEDPEVLFRRDQIRKRTKYIERQATADGGNEPPA
jgi:hypothetical protein